MSIKQQAFPSAHIFEIASEMARNTQTNVDHVEILASIVKYSPFITGHKQESGIRIGVGGTYFCDSHCHFCFTSRIAGQEFVFHTTLCAGLFSTSLQSLSLT